MVATCSQAIDLTHIFWYSFFWMNICNVWFLQCELTKLPSNCVPSFFKTHIVTPMCNIATPTCSIAISICQGIYMHGTAFWVCNCTLREETWLATFQDHNGIRSDKCAWRGMFCKLWLTKTGGYPTIGLSHVLCALVSVACAHNYGELVPMFTVSHCV